MRERFRPPDYEQNLFQLYQNSEQGTKSIHDYSADFLRLADRNNLMETPDQQVSRFMNGFKTLIRDKMGLQPIYRFEDAQKPGIEGRRNRETQQKSWILPQEPRGLRGTPA